MKFTIELRLSQSTLATWTKSLHKAQNIEKIVFRKNFNFIKKGVVPLRAPSSNYIQVKTKCKYFSRRALLKNNIRQNCAVFALPFRFREVPTWSRETCITFFDKLIILKCTLIRLTSNFNFCLKNWSFETVRFDFKANIYPLRGWSLIFFLPVCLLFMHLSLKMYRLKIKFLVS